MRTVQEIQFDVTGQSLYYDCPEGRPSSVTSATVYYWNATDLDTTLSWVIGAPSVETNPNTTIDAASGYGQSNPNVLNVTATTGFLVDRSYLVTGAAGFREWFDVVEIDSGNSVTARHPLHNGYAASDTVQSTRITATVDSTWVSEINYLIDNGPNPSYRVRWVYVVDGVTYVADTPFKLVRYPGKHGVQPQDIEASAPGWLDTLPSDHRNDQGRSLIDTAYRKVKFDLRQVDLATSSMAETEVTDELVILKTLELGEWSKLYIGAGDATLAKLSTQKYQERLDALVRFVSRVPVRDSSGAATAIVTQGLTRR